MEAPICQGASLSLFESDGGLERSLIGVFEEQVRLTPDRPAILSDTGEITYSELNALANSLGKEILQHHDGQSQTVALLLDQGPEKVVAALGVLKAGLAYAAVNASLPDRGIAELIDHSLSAIVLADNEYYSKALSLAGDKRRVINVSASRASSTQGDLGVRVGPDDMAFIVYTSGSTGNPKGVVYSNRAALHVARRAIEPCRVVERDKVSLLDNFGPTAIFGTLLSGACLCPFSLKKGGLADVAAWVKQHKITLFRGYPTAFRQLIASLDETDAPTTVRCVYLTGEAMRISDFLSYQRHFPDDCMFVTGYGCTEFLSAVSRAYEKSSMVEGGALASFSPQNGVEIVIVSENGASLPLGETGYIAIRSRYLSSGYWRRPDLTSQHYLSDPQRSETNIFVTADFGKMNLDGTVQIVGRQGQHVKIRNHRVMLSDIEAALSTHPSIGAAAVTTFENKKKVLRLAAYVVPRKNSELKSAVLRQYLARRLADYMMPSVFLFLDGLPLTSTGKVDRNALPPPRMVDRDDLASRVAPRTDLEEQIKDLLEALLGLQGVGVEDDFFSIGGDSLQATQLILEIEKRYDAKISATQVFEGMSTVARLANLVEKSRKPNGQRENIELDQRGGPTSDVDFVNFGAIHDVTSKAELYYVDPELSLRRARPNVSLGPISFNSLGFRGPEFPSTKPKGTIRLAFLGGSGTLDSHAHNNEAAWPHRVWRGLSDIFPDQKFDYINAALAGYNTRQMSIIFDHVISALEPDLVVIQAGDVNADTALKARETGVYDKVYYSPTWLARRVALWAKVEKNLTILMRLAFAQRKRGKLQFDAQELSQGFEERLEKLVVLCQSRGARVILVSGMGRLQPGQSLLEKLRAAVTHVYFMPYMSIDGLLSVRQEYRRVIGSVSRRTNAIQLDVANRTPADRHHYVDSTHFSDKGSLRMAECVVECLAKTLRLLSKSNETVATR